MMPAISSRDGAAAVAPASLADLDDGVVLKIMTSVPQTLGRLNELATTSRQFERVALRHPMFTAMCDALKTPATRAWMHALPNLPMNTVAEATMRAAAHAENFGCSATIPLDIAGRTTADIVRKVALAEIHAQRLELPACTERLREATAQARSAGLSPLSVNDVQAAAASALIDRQLGAMPAARSLYAQPELYRLFDRLLGIGHGCHLMANHGGCTHVLQRLASHWADIFHEVSAARTAPLRWRVALAEAYELARERGGGPRDERIDAWLETPIARLPASQHYPLDGQYPDHPAVAPMAGEAELFAIRRFPPFG